MLCYVNMLCYMLIMLCYMLGYVNNKTVDHTGEGAECL